jgi:vancomycin resistance protein YoaR
MKKTGKYKFIILILLFILLYLISSLYFTRHFFFNTTINGVNVSLKTCDDAENIIRNFVDEYELQLIEREGKSEKITGQDIEMLFNEKTSIFKVCSEQHSFQWIVSLFKKENYYIKDLFVYHNNSLENKINNLQCLNKEMTEPQNASFQYLNGSYVVVEEVKGDKIIPEKLEKAIQISILNGKKKLDLDKKHCYENPRYTLTSDKTLKTRDLLNKYVSSNITYRIRSEREIIDGDIIDEWLIIDENLEVNIDEIQVRQYMNELAEKYDTIGKKRRFKTSIGKTIEVEGGLYGWKIDRDAETKDLMKNISLGKVIEKEPVYAQKALSEGDDEIGNTYVEINITRQYLWFYKNDKLIAQGPIVTGNPNERNATATGIYMLNYKQKGATLMGPGYKVKVNYWMPFFGNIGIHDAGWRYSFGGEIYKTNGTHGCVNVQLYLAKIIFENIESGIPIICYKE